jgi:hypothetical protein
MKKMLMLQVAVQKEIEKDWLPLPRPSPGIWLKRENLRGIVFIEDDTDDDTLEVPA